MERVVFLKGEGAQQCFVVRIDYVAADRAEVAFANEPAIRAIDAPYMRHLVLEARRRIRGPQIRRLGEMRVAIDDLDAFEEWIDPPEMLCLINFLDVTARRSAFIQPITAS